MAVQRDDPYGAFNFVVSIDGEVIAGFSEVSGLASEIDVIEYRDGNDVTNTVRKLPGLRKFANIVLKRGVTGSVDLFRWYAEIGNGNPMRRTVVLTMLDEQRQPVLTWRIVRAWPRRYEGPCLNATANEVAIETLELAHEGLEVE